MSEGLDLHESLHVFVSGRYSLLCFYLCSKILFVLTISEGYVSQRNHNHDYFNTGYFNFHREGRDEFEHTYLQRI